MDDDTAIKLIDKLSDYFIEYHDSVPGAWEMPVRDLVYDLANTLDSVNTRRLLTRKNGLFLMGIAVDMETGSPELYPKHSNAALDNADLEEMRVAVAEAIIEHRHENHAEAAGPKGCWCFTLAAKAEVLEYHPTRRRS